MASNGKKRKRIFRNGGPIEVHSLNCCEGGLLCVAQSEKGSFHCHIPMLA